MTQKISYYFERIEGLAQVDDLPSLIDSHRSSFEKYGWELVPLNEKISQQHPLFSVFNDEMSVFNSSKNGWEYTRACYMRWLAYASAGHFFADFDIMNYGFTYENALELRELAGGPTFVSGAGAVGLFQGAEYDHILEAFLAYQREPFVRGMLEGDVNDMTVLLECRHDLFSLIGMDDTRIARDYSCPGWQVAQLVHYPYHYTTPPRVKTIRAERPC